MKEYPGLLSLILLVILSLPSGCESIGQHVRPPERSTMRTSILEKQQYATPETEQGNLAKYRVKIPFVLRVRTHPGNPPPEAVQICASTNARIFEQIKLGVLLSEVSCFAPGTGMATSRLGEDPRDLYLFLSDGDAHNYYSVDKRVDGPGYSDIYVKGVTGANDQTLTSGVVYAVVYVDDNQNGVMEESEYEFLELTLGR